MASTMHTLRVMPRAIWKGALAFGLVNIPVEIHTAVRDHRPRFRMLHAADKSPVKLDRVCVRDGHTVSWQELVKGYEYEKGHFVVLTKEDFKAAAVEKTRTIDIIDFVESKDIDDRYFETPYYLVPAAKHGEHAYALLREAIRSSGRTGVAKFILRDTQHLAAIEAIDSALVLSVMRFADELVDVKGFTLPHVTLRKEELNMATLLVQSLAAEWDPSKYEDEYKNNLMKVIKGKLKGKKPTLAAQEPHRPANVVNLMERLRQSLEQAGKSKRAVSRRKPASTHKRRTA
jgi:DNA end-binding protein Ku